MPSTDETKEVLERVLQEIYDYRFWAFTRDPALFKDQDPVESSRKLGWTQGETAVLQAVCNALGHPYSWLEGVCHD